MPDGKNNDKKENNETKNVGGRPPHYPDSEALQSKISDYFNQDLPQRTIGTDKNGNAIKVPVPTISGLAYYLGFESRQSFYDYEKREGFSYTVKRARLFIESEYEQQLQVGSTAGAIFALKNMGWFDKTQTDITTNGENVSIPPIEWVKNKNDDDAQ